MIRQMTADQMDLLLSIDAEGRRGFARSVFDADAVKALMSLKAAGFVKMNDSKWHLTAGGCQVVTWLKFSRKTIPQEN